MTSLNDYFLAGRKVLERWRPSPNAAAARAVGRPMSPDPDASTGASQSPGDQPWPPSLESLLAQVGELPPYSLTLGACDDGLPFLLDLNYPAPGALLVCGDAGCGKTRLLHALADSAIAQNGAEQVQFSILALDSQVYLDLTTTDHCQEIFPVDDPVVVDLIQELSQLVEARRRGRPEDPAIVLLIDGLAECLGSLDQDTFERLYRLARHGPRARVWTIASLDTRQLQSVDGRFLAAFRTHLLGRIRNRRSAESLAEPGAPIDTRDLEDGLFLMPYGEEWLRLWTCAASQPAPNPETPSRNLQEDEV